MVSLSSAQRAYLRRLAHDLRPVVQLGKNGLTPNMIETVDRALAAHELIKLKFMDYQDQKNEFSEEIASQTGSELVALVGNVAILYRRSADPDRRTIELP